MLVVAPTRELAQQSQDVVEAAGKTCGIRSVSVYGGVSKDSQRRSLSANGGVPYEVVIATPGKLKNYSISNIVQDMKYNFTNFDPIPFTVCCGYS